MYKTNTLFIIFMMLSLPLYAEVAPRKAKLEYAKDFSIEYLENGLKILTDAAGAEVLLVPRGEKIPKKYQNMNYLYTPIDRVIYTSTTQVGLLRAFSNDSVYKSIIGVRQSADEWDIDAIKDRMHEGKIKDIGSSSEHSTNYDYETIRVLKPNLVLTGYGMSVEQVNLTKMLDSAKIQYLLDGSSREDDLKGTLEWVKFYGALYGVENEAKEYFDGAIARINNIKNTVSKAPVRPKAANGIITMGKIYVENGNSKFAKMIEDCGADYIFKDIGSKSQGITVVSVEEFFARLSKGGIYIDRGMIKYGADKNSITNQIPVLASLPCFKNNLVWKVSNTFWSSYHDIDKKYLEMAAIFHPELFPDVKFEHFIHLEK